MPGLLFRFRETTAWPDGHRLHLQKHDGLAMINRPRNPAVDGIAILYKKLHIPADLPARTVLMSVLVIQKR